QSDVVAAQPAVVDFESAGWNERVTPHPRHGRRCKEIEFADRLAARDAERRLPRELCLDWACQISVLPQVLDDGAYGVRPKDLFGHADVQETALQTPEAVVLLRVLRGCSESNALVDLGDANTRFERRGYELLLESRCPRPGYESGVGALGANSNRDA